MASSRPIYFYIAALHILAALLLFTRGARTFPLPSLLSWSGAPTRCLRTTDESLELIPLSLLCVFTTMIDSSHTK